MTWRHQFDGLPHLKHELFFICPVAFVRHDLGD